MSETILDDYSQRIVPHTGEGEQTYTILSSHTQRMLPRFANPHKLNNRVVIIGVVPILSNNDEDVLTADHMRPSRIQGGRLERFSVFVL